MLSYIYDVYKWVFSQLRSSHDSFHARLQSTEARLKMAEDDHTMDLETALIKLEEEQQRLVTVHCMFYNQICILFILHGSVYCGVQGGRAAECRP